MTSFKKKAFATTLVITALAASTLLYSLTKAPDSKDLPIPGKVVQKQEVEKVTLRGYGTLSAEGIVSETAQGKISLVRFSTESKQAAQVVASKYIADFTAYGAIEEIKDPSLSPASIFNVKNAGKWIVGVKNNEVYVLSSANDAALKSAASTLAAESWEKPAANAYPRYLDCFDNAALGKWWMPSTKPTEILEYFRKNEGIVNGHGQNIATSFAPNVIDTSASENDIAQARYINKPFRLMIWEGLPAWWKPETFNNSRHTETTAPAALNRSLYEMGGYYQTQICSPEANAIHIDTLRHMMDRYKDDPNLIAWLEPHGEFNLQEGPAMVPPNAKKRFAEYLQKVKGYNLSKANELHGDNAKSWDDIYYPDTAYFYGRRGEFFDLDEKPWKWQPGLDLEKGTAAKWNDPAFDDSSWPENLRYSPNILSQFDGSSRIWPLWYRFTVDIPKSILQGSGPLYLHIMPSTEQKGAVLSVWINGTEVKLDKDHMRILYLHTQFDATSALKEGKNTFAIYSKGGRIKYRVFLSRTGQDEFPYKDSKLNQLYLDWNQYLCWEKFQTLKLYLAAMRAVDPVRPIKVMTPHMFQAEAMDLLDRFGAYAQLTGEGAGFYRPMHYKGYSRLRGLPGSSEPGGPSDNAVKMQGMFANIFWESQDCHDYVFDPQRDFWEYKDVVKWWEDNTPLLKTLGKTDFGPIRVGVLRDVQQDSNYQNGLIWKWDLSRGPLPSAGVSPVLIDGPEFDLGLADKVPVIFDCATTVMTPERVASIARYIKLGGTFVALHNTGRHTPTVRDAWPLAKAFGLQISDRKTNTVDEGVHKWETEKIKFTADQKLIPSLKDKILEGGGVSIDYLGHEDTGAIVIKASKSNTKAIATWEDGSMAICDTTIGKGHLIWLGTPFHLRFKDENGKWMNDDTRQALFEEMLAGLGVEPTVESTDKRVWIEKRESKNGLYTVYMTAAANIREKNWKFEDKITTDLTLLGVKEPAVLEMTQLPHVDIPTTQAPNGTVIKEQSYTPCQVRQFAIVRPNVGLEAPLHWLQVQKNQWRALDIRKDEQVDLSKIDAIVAEQIKLSGMAGLDIRDGWKVRKFNSEGEKVSDNWTATDYKDASWESGKLGTWLLNKWLDTKVAQYRNTITLPKDWDTTKKRVIFGVQGYHGLGIIGKCNWWLNGKPMETPLANNLRIDITDAIQNGTVEIAFEISGDNFGCGPAATFFLQSTSKPTGTLKLDGAWTTLSDWHKADGSIDLPGKVKGIFGLRKTFDIPEKWAGKKIRLVIEQDSTRGIEGIIINGLGYARVSPDVTDTFFPVGFRIDPWLKPGKNTIELFPPGHHNITKKVAIDVQIKNARLEVFE